MGEAKRRGTKEQRIAQSIERHQQEKTARALEQNAADKAFAERVRALPPEARKVVLLRRSSPKHRALIAAMAMALSSK
jgi:hypothetical protein